MHIGLTRFLLLRTITFSHYYEWMKKLWYDEIKEAKIKGKYYSHTLTRLLGYIINTNRNNSYDYYVNYLLSFV